jgi:hypothetical protein
LSSSSSRGSQVVEIVIKTESSLFAMSSYVQVYRRSLLFLGLLAVIPVGGFQELLKKALTHHQSGDLKEAVGYYGRLKEKLGASTPVAVLSNYGAALLGLDLISEAEEVWRDALVADPSHAETHVNLAISLQNDALVSRSRLADAKRHAEEALSLRGGTGYVKAHHALANALQALGDHAGAQHHWALAEGRDPGGGPTEGGSGSSPSWQPRQLPSFASSLLTAGDRVQHAGTGLVLDALSRPERPRGAAGLDAPPLLFAIDDFLSADECEHIIDTARPRLKGSFVVGDSSAGDESSAADLGEGGRGGGAARTSSNAWLPMGKDAVLAAVRARAAGLLEMPVADFLPLAEDLQVVRYRPGQHFALHHDSSAAFQRRLLTLLVYLNDVEEGNGGETWFPFAPASPTTAAAADQGNHGSDEAASSDGDRRQVPSSRAGLEAALAKAQRMEDATAGLRVVPRRGRAILFYNIQLENGEPDPSAIHAALPLSGVGEKWIANFWVAC